MDSQAKRVEDLSQYGKALNSVPEPALKKQKQIFMAEIRGKYGRLGRIVFFIRVFVEQRRLKKAYPEAFATMQGYGRETAAEFPLLIAMFNVVAKRDGGEGAYRFMNVAFQKLATEIGMAAMYDVDELVECEGDVFDNFKKMNVAMFEASEHLYHPARIEDETDKLTIIIDRCAVPEMAGALNCPEMGTIGCDFDLAGYPAIEARVDAEFRRPCTIAKGAETCEFRFYRRGTAPEIELIDGVPMRWEKHLNR